MKQPADVTLSREDGEALLARLDANALPDEDRRVLGKVLTFYFWYLFALREAKLSLRRLKTLVCGDKLKKREPPSSSGTTGGGNPGGSGGKTEAVLGVPEAAVPESAPAKPRPPGHGRQGAEVYRAAPTVACGHEEFAVGERCPACGRGSLYRLPPGVEMRLDGNARLSAVRYELEKLRCSAGGQICTASVPAAAGAEKYSARARAVLALARYYLGVPWYRLEQVQALVGGAGTGCPAVGSGGGSGRLYLSDLQVFGAQGRAGRGDFSRGHAGADLDLEGGEPGSGGPGSSHRRRARGGIPRR